ncbi:hypothetical protein O3M35_000684 [Rhynocoris fuscipes]|uniref:Odorant receptor n=1 Tax=Rhynocoris fuscipes TaxID=488301 RepID=A0AAW1DR18_9HEMI
MQLSFVYPDFRKGFHRYISIAQGIVFTFTVGYALIVCSLTVIKIQEDLLIASQGLHFFILQVATLTVVVTTNARRNHYRYIHKTIGIGPVEYDEETKNGMKTVQEKLNTRKNFLISGIIGYLVLAAFVTVIIAPFIDSLTNGRNENIYSPGGVSLNLPVPLWSPFGTDTTWGYLISLFMELLCAYEMTSIVVAGDVALLVSTQYLTMELQLLTTALKKMPERTVRIYKSNHNIDPEKYINVNYMRDNGHLLKCYGYCLKETAVHYQKIIK